MGSSSWLSSLSSTITTTTTPTFGNRSSPPLSCVSVKKKSSRSWSCRGRDDDADAPLTAASAYAVLGLQPNCSSAAEVKAAFRAKVKQFHPDTNRDRNSDAIIRRVIDAYKVGRQVLLSFLVLCCAVLPHNNILLQTSNQILLTHSTPVQLLSNSNSTPSEIIEER